MTFEEMEQEIIKLKSLVDERISEDVKYRRMLEDLSINLTLENMPTVKKEVNKSAEKISQISADIEGIFQGVSSIEQRVNEQGADISLIVSEKDGEKTVNSASIVAAINESESSVKVSADKISFEGSDISIDTDKLTVNSDGHVEFSSPIVSNAIFGKLGYFKTKVDLANSHGQHGYAFVCSNDNDGLELRGVGGIVLSAEVPGKSGTGDVEVYADSMRFNDNRVLTDSDADIAYLRAVLGNY